MRLELGAFLSGGSPTRSLAELRSASSGVGTSFLGTRTATSQFPVPTSHGSLPRGHYSRGGTGHGVLLRGGTRLGNLWNHRTTP